MKFLGIDFGTKKIGLSLSDDDGLMAFPSEVVPNTEKGISRIYEIIDEHNISDVVIGDSKNFRMEDNPVAENINEFTTKVENDLKVKIHSILEVLTSRQANSVQAMDQNTDARSAAIILQTYLDGRRR